MNNSDAFNYLAVLLSIIIGLGMTQVLTATGRLIRHRAVVRFYWPAMVWAGLLLLVYVQSWWAMFGLRGLPHWRFIDFLIVLTQTITLYMMAAVALPETVGDEIVDLREHYRTQHAWFFGFFLATLVVSVLKDVITAGALPSAANLAFHGAFAAIGTAAMISRRDSVDRIVASMAAIAFAAYVSALFATLR